jgi:hypothetical protein
MKKFSLIFTLAILLSVFAISLASAQSKMGNVKGTVSGSDELEGTIEILTTKGDTFIVLVPEGFDFESSKEGAVLHVKGHFNEDGEIVADWIKESKGRGDQEEGSKADSAYCRGGKEKFHPLAVGIEEVYGLSVEDTMQYFCKGYGFGQIMLALQTKELKGVEVSETLEARKAGMGWGQIWKELKLIGQPGEASSPPGHLKRPAHAGPPEGKGNNQP